MFHPSFAQLIIHSQISHTNLPFKEFVFIRTLFDRRLFTTSWDKLYDKSTVPEVYTSVYTHTFHTSLQGKNCGELPPIHFNKLLSAFLHYHCLIKQCTLWGQFTSSLYSNYLIHKQDLPAWELLVLDIYLHSTSKMDKMCYSMHRGCTHTDHPKTTHSRDQ